MYFVAGAVAGIGLFLLWGIFATLLRVEKRILIMTEKTKSEKHWGWGKHK